MLSHKRTLLVFISLTLFLTLFNTAYLAPTPQTSVKIGVVLSTSGRAAPWGTSAKNGIELAAREINRKGGINGRPLEVIYKDSKTSGEEAIKALRELIADHHIQVVIGDVTSTCVLAMAETANQSNVVLITPGASNPSLSKKGDFIFRYWYSDELEGKADARYARQKRDWQRVLTVYLDAPYGQGINEVFTTEFRALNGEVVQTIPVRLGQDVFTDEVERIFEEPNLDGIFLASYVYENIEFLKQFRAKSIQTKRSIPILSTQTFNSLDIVRGAGDAANEVVFSVPPPPDPSNKTAEDFREQYKREYHRDLTVDPADFAATAYDSLKIVSDALKSGARTGVEIREALENQTAFQGAAFGLVNFDQRGDISPSFFVYKRVRNGKFEFLNDSQPAAISGQPPVSSWTDWLHSTTAQLVAMVAGAAIIGLSLWLFNRHWLAFWQQLRWHRAAMWFWKERLFNRSGRKIVTLNDYVDILEKLRNGIVKKCNNLRGDTKPTITIYSYTMQLPSDWPLWHVDLDEVEQSPTPLERYFLSFKKFLRAVGSNYEVSVKRIIIIDSVKSPMGQARLKALEKDVTSEYFQKYVELLHTNEDDAYYHVRQRPWPGWFTDSVFYALTEPGRNHRRWLWGVTTSYNAGEDLIILRLHHLGKKGTGVAKYLALPFPVSSMDELAEMADTMGAKKLGSLRGDGSTGEEISQLRTNATDEDASTPQPQQGPSQTTNGAKQ